MTPATTIELRIELVTEQRPICGRLLDRDGEWRGFDGYLGLMAAIDDAIASSPEAAAPSGTTDKSEAEPR